MYVHVMSNAMNGDQRDLTAGRDLTAAIESVARSESALVEFLKDVGPVEPSQPSRLPGWTVGHVLTHLARNADSHVAMLSGAPQYANGAEGRNAAIESGAARPWVELVADVEAAGSALMRTYAGHSDWAGTAHALSGERPMAMLPQLRQREVELHHIDLGLGYDFAALPADYVRRELRVLEMVWKARQPMGLTSFPAAALALAPTDRLAWLTGRSEPDGLEPAGVF
jgi:maleylpyruvate isomerase